MTAITHLNRPQLTTHHQRLEMSRQEFLAALSAWLQTKPHPADVIAECEDSRRAITVLEDLLR